MKRGDEVSLYKLNTQDMEYFQMKLPIITRKFNYFVTESEILNWLFNFERKDRRDALDILSFVKSYDNNEIIEGYDYCLRKVIGKLSGDTKIVVLPLGDYGKSGTAMVYYMRKTECYKENENKFLFVSNSKQLKAYRNKDVALVLIDDFFGSGESAITFFNHAIEPQVSRFSTYPSIYLASLATQSSAKKKLESEIPCDVISFNEMDEVFSKKSSIFGQRKHMLKFRRLCHYYGEKLYKDHPLGYSNSQALVTFAHGTPNNTLPIIWASTPNWTPIFPRFFSDRVNKSRQFRKESAEMLSTLRTLGVSNYFLSKNNVNTKGLRTFRDFNFKLFSIVRLKKAKRPKNVICQILGINTADYDNIMIEAVKMNVFDSDGNLTVYAEQAYYEILRNLRKLKFVNRPEQTKDKAVYLPDSFRGYT